MKKQFFAIWLFWFATPANLALSATGDVLFNGTVAATCALVVTSNGIMTVSTDLQTLSSHNIGGSAGLLTLSTTGGVVLAVDPITTTSEPAADTSSTTWTPTYHSSGAHTIAETGSNTTLSAPGSSTVAVHVAGTKGGTDRFASGAYQTTVTVRCE